jgi:hypothetical protein
MKKKLQREDKAREEKFMRDHQQKIAKQQGNKNISNDQRRIVPFKKGNH